MSSGPPPIIASIARPPVVKNRQGVIAEKQVLPEGVRYPSRGGYGDQQADDDVPDDGGPFHDEGVRDGGESGRAGQAAAEAAVVGHGHVHRGVAFHGARHRLVCLLARRSNELRGQEAAEQQRDAQDHQRAADELGEGELPAE